MQKVNEIKNIALLLCISLLVSCKADKNDINTETNLITELTTTIAAVPENIQTTENQVTKSTPPPKIKKWAEAYVDFIKQEENEIYGFDFLLTDVDFDGVPELFSIHLGGDYSCALFIECILQFSENKVSKFDIHKTVKIPAALELYQDKETGEKRWVSMTDRNGYEIDYEHFYNYWYWVDFNDFSDIKLEFFFGYDTIWVPNSNGEFNEEFLDYLQESPHQNSEVPTEKEEIEKRKQEVFSGYEKIEIRELYLSGRDNLTAELLSQW